MSDSYKVIFKNNSVNLGSVCLYQDDPALATNVMSLAWLTKVAHPTTTVEISWNIDYNFVWSETGELVPGIIFKAYQTWDADLRDNNKVRFAYKDGAFTFEALDRGNAGELLIEGDYSLPLNQASVGIGMSGAGTFISQAQSNINTFYQPHPLYWITFGTYDQGEVLDITKITNKALIEFPANVYTMVATLNQDNSWTVEPQK